MVAALATVGALAAVAAFVGAMRKRHNKEAAMASQNNGQLQVAVSGEPAD